MAPLEKRLGWGGGQGGIFKGRIREAKKLAWERDCVPLHLHFEVALGN